ncbi:CAP domain-containing protein [Streptomyces sp. NBC_01216]|uniref:CAP domain-containing protein n=1 Tax=unclassified Streptomyces TaxID=2593676 RepID=UPI002E15D7A7|nr:CAP domain-containing protein [Streptomyces sp. NBC_01216]
MGRHRRSGAAPAAEGYADGTDRRHRGTRRRRPVRTGLLGASAAVAVGAVAVASGLIPGGGDTVTVGSAGSGERQTQSQRAPELLTQQGGASATASDEPTGTVTGPGGAASPASPSRTAAPSPTATPSAKPKPKPAASKEAPAKASPTKEAPAKASPTRAAPTKAAAPAPKKTAAVEPSRTARPKPTTQPPVQRTQPPAPVNREAAAAAEVARLVNQERAKVGCTPVTVDARLAALADAFSADMATRGFFDHTDPDGATPWARAAKAGIVGMGGENIARGQVDAAAVVASWMNSDGHRANILNCDFRTMGVGVHFADGGPWWTQDFGY